VVCDGGHAGWSLVSRKCHRACMIGSQTDFPGSHGP
jgi:hypothetical protein